MKNGNWVPIDATMAKYLPLDRPYTVIEAIYCLQLNYDKGSTVTVAGLAKLWGWKSRGKVSRFLEAIGVEIVYHKDMEKSRNKRGVLVFSKRTYDEHKTDIERTNNGHIRLINNKWLDYETDIKRAYGGHKTDIGCSTINHTTDPYPEKEKEGGIDDRDRNLGNDGDRDLDAYNGSQGIENEIEPGFAASTQEGDGAQGQYKVKADVRGVPGNHGDDNNGRPGEKPLPCGGSLNGSDTANARTGLDDPRPGFNDNIHTGDNRGSDGDSISRDGVDGQAPVGKGGAQVDREEVGDGMVGLGDNRRVDPADHGGVSLSDKGELNHDPLGAKKENEAKPAKKAKEKNGIPYQEIVTLLNEHAGKNFRHTAKQTQALIRARWRDGYTVDDFRRVIIGRVEKWSGDPKMCEYLRPPTLFGGKFESYLQADSTIKKVNLPKKQNKIKCKECANFGTCQNAEEDPIASCALYTPQREMVAA